VSKLELDGLAKRFGSTVVVDNFTMSLGQGEFVSLLGPSGCGKTTTLRMIAGFLAPSAGLIRLDGKEISSPESVMAPETRSMSMIFQSYAIWPHMTVGENVAFGLKLRKLATAQIERDVKEMLKMVRLEAFMDRYPAELSGGQQQRVALARAIVVKPSVLLLDEPLSNLDANLREEMRFEIRRLHDAFRITTVYVTHDQAEAMVTSDRIAVMNAGKVEQVDQPARLYALPKTRFVASFIGKTNLVPASRDKDAITLGSSRIELKALHPESLSQWPERQDLSLSIRPQSLQLHPQRPGERDGYLLWPAKIIARAYLGDTWDYQVRVEGLEEALRVTARPQEVFELEQHVWLSLDLPQVVALQD